MTLARVITVYFLCIVRFFIASLLQSETLYWIQLLFAVKAKIKISSVYVRLLTDRNVIACFCTWNLWIKF